MRIVSLYLLLLFATCKSSDGEPYDTTLATGDSTMAAANSAMRSEVAVPDTSDIGLPTRRHREEGKLYPVDEAPRQPSLVAFRQNLLAAIKRKDVEELVAAMAPDIQLGFSGDDGRDDFRKQWGLDKDPGASDIWRELFQVLMGGGVWVTDLEDGESSETLFRAPAAFSTFNGRDAFTQSVIIGEGVNVRAKPNASATILAQLSYELVDLVDVTTQPSPKLRIGDYDYGWTEVKLADGRRGFVSDKFVTSPIGYRVSIEQKDGTWQITQLTVGD